MRGRYVRTFRPTVPQLFGHGFTQEDIIPSHYRKYPMKHYTRVEILHFMLQCRSPTSNYQHCFVGKCLANRQEVEQYSKISGNQLVARVWNTMRFKPEFQGYESRFWSMIQNFHDWDYLWKPGSYPYPEYPLPPGIEPVNKFCLSPLGVRHYRTVLKNLEFQHQQEVKNFSKSLKKTISSMKG